jgi:hypothetical protein
MQTKPTAASQPPTLEDEARAEIRKDLSAALERHTEAGKFLLERGAIGLDIPADKAPEWLAAFARQRESATRAEAVADTLKEFVRRIAEDESCGLLGDNPFGYLQAVAAEMFEEAKR